MAIPKRIEIKGLDAEGNEKVVYLQLPNAEANKEAQLAYNRALRRFAVWSYFKTKAQSGNARTRHLG